MNIISAHQLRDLQENKAIVIVDARGGADAYDRYSAGHLENALFADLETDLSQKTDNPANGGRHPLPEPAAFGKLLGRLGISPEKTVIAYDDKKGANAAARFWWMLKAAGHEKAYVVSGGLDALVSAGFTVTQQITETQAANDYPVTEWIWPIVHADFVAQAASNPEFLVIDVRENYRYLGESEPIDLVAGHIPGAVNIPFMSNLEADGTFRSAEKLAERYSSAIAGRNPENVIVHCGSGVTACHTLLALEEAGFSGAGLYVGSWSEWSRNDRPIATANS
ncbi:sulfurtransferase [Dyadobacter sediminis]|uniref:Sulfurtransferase n=1 Tax=Dyadobacter sediminis TaxID=1493691 RepID=A0A5R9KKL3_9BACT|nr:sulfurtransferase [Dyadobacter sediminis]TLU96762.1 sulfurtransferase [Dyadobacter sediminis]GGB84949.1 thiosulfate sulfurtransferase [Dyadobacter sediminis]